MAHDNGNGNGTRATPPAWRFAFFAGVIMVILFGGQLLNIPREVSVPLLVGSLIALANGAIPTWFGRGK